jgi:hypothetical protein
VNEDQAPRRNPHLGILCPPWCRIDHADQLGTACVGGGGGIDHIWTRAIRSRDGFEVGVTGLGPEEGDESLYLGLDLHGAGQLAGLVELLAAATPDQIRELATAIRRAAGDITEAGDG